MKKLTIYRNDFNNKNFDKVLLKKDITQEMMNMYDLSFYSDIFNKRFAKEVLKDVLFFNDIKEKNIYFELI
tara:strand:+ start:753 stop:965 length:213 start_codon:yes stop_codon:yes gene_type:complete